MNSQNRGEFNPSARFLGLLRGVAAVSMATVILGIYRAPDRVWPAVLLASYAFVGVGLAGLFFIALEYVTKASWCVALRRVPEAMAATLPVGAAGLLIVFIGHPSLYSWYGHPWPPAEGYLGFKQAWLSQPFFVLRAAVYLTIWIVFAALLVRNSWLQDSRGSVQLTRRNLRLSAFFIVLFAFTFWLASYDWIMSLEPEWYSTIFGVYHFAGMFSSGLGVIAILTLWMHKHGAFDHAVQEKHLVDLARLLAAFCTFWAYIWFSQYMLIWYANLPEETSHFLRRSGPGWNRLFVLNLLLNWVVPFLALLPRSSKRNPRILSGVASIVVCGHLLDLYLMIEGPTAGGPPAFGIWEAAALLGAASVFVLVFTHAVRRAPLVPLGDPLLEQSLHYHP